MRGLQTLTRALLFVAPPSPDGAPRHHHRPCYRYHRPTTTVSRALPDNNNNSAATSRRPPSGTARQAHRDGAQEEESPSPARGRRDASKAGGEGEVTWGEEEDLRRIAADALLPVLFPTTTTGDGGDVKPVDAEGGLRRCLRRGPIPATTAATGDDAAGRRGRMRRRLAQLILGTSVMRLRHSYVLNATLARGPTTTTAGPSDDDEEETRHLLGSLLSPLKPARATPPKPPPAGAGGGDSREEERPGDETERRRTIVRSMVDLHAEYLSSDGDFPSSSSSGATPSSSPSEIDFSDWPEDPADRIAVRHSLPPFLARLLVDQYGERDAERIAIVSNRPGPITLRRNDVAAVTGRMLRTGATPDGGNAIDDPSEVTRRKLADDALCRRLLDEEGIRAAPMNSKFHASAGDDRDCDCGEGKGRLGGGGGGGFDDDEEAPRQPRQRTPPASTPNDDDDDTTAYPTFPPGCIRITSGRPKSVWATKAWRDGWFEVQDAGSQMVAEATGAAPGEFVVDYCAGNGGKALAMASRMSSRGTIVAHDIREGRLAQLRGSLGRAGLVGGGSSPVPGDEGGTLPSSSPIGEGVTVRTTADSSDIPPGSADAVLVDAPCSSSGALRRRPSHRWTLTGEEQILRDLPALQLRILADAAKLVKRGGGGRLVYATCSLIGAENEGVAGAFEGAADFERDWERWPFDDSPGWDDGRRSAPAGDGGNWRVTLPHLHDCDGFFIARWKRR